jgi:hypothetical protein
MKKLAMKKLIALAALCVVAPLLAQQGATPPPETQTEVPFRLGGTTPMAGGATDTRPVPRMPDGKPDFWGTWVGGGPVDNIERQGGLKEGELASIMKPEALKIFKSRTNEQDPHNFCFPMGVPRQAGAFPWRWVRYPTHEPATHLFLLWEANVHSFRQIFMDGRKHPDDLEPSWFGHSVGSWDGDTLVIDTIGYNDRFWFDRLGHPHTEQLHTIERWTRVNYTTLENVVTIDDPGAYTRPWTVKFQAKLSKPGDELMEYFCVENNQFGAAGGHANPFKP